MQKLLPEAALRSPYFPPVATRLGRGARRLPAPFQPAPFVKLAFSRLLGTATLLACAPSQRVPPTAPAPLAGMAQSVIPAPASLQLASNEPFLLSDSTVVAYTMSPADAVSRIADDLAGLLAPTGLRATRALAAGDPTPRGALRLVLNADAASLGDEGYSLIVMRDSVVLTARQSAGLFHGVQTIRQLLPVSVEYPGAMQRRLWIPGVRIVDAPRFAWRGAMLDVSRHFLEVDDVKRFLDGMALYKFNRLHLHLSDDQGWRLEIKAWPALAQIGGRSEVGGGVGGFYTQAQYSELVAYARDRYITIVPEIEMPGHSNAALSAIPLLNCSGIAAAPYSGTNVGFSTFCASSDTVFSILNDVIREVAALTPGEFIHIGGDEVEKLGHAQFLRFVERAEQIVRSHGKRMIGWGEIAPATLDPSTVVQHWRYRAGKSEDSAYLHAARGGMIIASPGAKTYLDMKYDSATVLGLRWAGLIGIRDAYEWEPSTLMTGVSERSVLGVEAPLWSETLEKRADFEFMAYPRLLAIAEIGWTPRDQRRWADFRARLAEHGPRLQALGVNFYRAPEVPWRW